MTRISDVTFRQFCVDAGRFWIPSVVKAKDEQLLFYRIVRSINHEVGLDLHFKSGVDYRKELLKIKFLETPDPVATALGYLERFP